MNTFTQNAKKITLTLIALLAIAGTGCKKTAKDAAQLFPLVPPPQGNSGQGTPTSTTSGPVVEFKVWKELLGDYRLTQYQGQPADGRYSKIEESLSVFFDKPTQKRLDGVIFPLYASYSTNSDSTYNFGPIEGKGETTIIEADGLKVYTYKFDGPITVEGYDVVLRLELQVTQEGQNLYVTYTLEIPNEISKVTRNFTLQK